MTDKRAALVEKVARAICAEKCAFRGEPACYRVMDDSPFTWPPETCCEPGCVAEATAAIAIVLEEAEQMTRPPAHMLGSTDSYANGYRAACDEIAAALRAYVSKHIILPLPQENINAES